MQPFEIAHEIDGQGRTTAEGAIVRLAARQHGVVARGQLFALGFGRGAIANRLARGRLHRVHPGVYAVGRPDLPPGGMWAAAVLACGPDAVLSHRSAAALWGLHPGEASRVDVTAPGRRRRNRPGIQLHQPRALDANERTVRLGIPITTVARTLLDLAGVVPPRRIRQAFDQAERLGLLDLTAVEALLARAKRSKGIGVLRALVRECTEPPDTRSELEEKFVELCREHNLPLPAMNCVVASHTVDALWPRQRLVVELDGFAFHRSREAFESDRARDADLQLAGYRVIRVTVRRLERESVALVSSLRSLLEPSLSRSRHEPGRWRRS
jgi:very-short-patch-repair endonuclease